MKAGSIEPYSTIPGRVRRLADKVFDILELDGNDLPVQLGQVRTLIMRVFDNERTIWRGKRMGIDRIERERLLALLDPTDAKASFWAMYQALGGTGTEAELRLELHTHNNELLEELKSIEEQVCSAQQQWNEMDERVPEGHSKAGMLLADALGEDTYHSIGFKFTELLDALNELCEDAKDDEPSAPFPIQHRWAFDSEKDGEFRAPSSGVVEFRGSEVDIEAGDFIEVREGTLFVNGQYRVVGP